MRQYCNCTAQIPFVKRAPLVTFRKPIGSVSVSGHKFIGAPVPCGVVITRQRYVEALSRCAFVHELYMHVGTALGGSSALHSKGCNDFSWGAVRKQYWQQCKQGVLSGLSVCAARVLKGPLSTAGGGLPEAACCAAHRQHIHLR